MTAPTIVFVSTVAETAMRFVAPLAECLREGGWETVAVAQGAIELGGFDRTYELPAFRRRGIRRNLAALVAIERVLVKESPAVVHLHTPGAVALGRIAALRAGVPSISVIHGTFLGMTSWRGLLFALAELPFAWSSRRTVVMNSEDARFYRRISRKGAVVIAPVGGLGVKAVVLSSPPADVPTALYLGRFATDKNIDFLVDAWLLAREILPEFQLRLVGGAVSGDSPWIPRHYCGLSYGPWTEDIRAEFERASVVVSASRREGFSLVVAEAVCAGLPVVTVANRGVREIARHAGEHVYLVSPDVRIFARAMAEAALNSSRLPRADLLARWGIGTAIAFHRHVIEEALWS